MVGRDYGANERAKQWCPGACVLVEARLSGPSVFEKLPTIIDSVLCTYTKARVNVATTLTTMPYEAKPGVYVAVPDVFIFICGEDFVRITRDLYLATQRAGFCSSYNREQVYSSEMRAYEGIAKLSAGIMDGTLAYKA